MPGRPGYILRLRARDDLESIWHYTFTTWGLTQADHYLKSLVARFEWLAENPQLGKPRNDIKTGYRCFPEGQHLVFYKMAQHRIDIIGIIHQSQDVIAQLKDEDNNSE